MNALFWFQTSLLTFRQSTLLILFSVNRVESGGFEQDTMNLLLKGKINEIQRTR